MVYIHIVRWCTEHKTSNWLPIIYTRYLKECNVQTYWQLPSSKGLSWIRNHPICIVKFPEEMNELSHGICCDAGQPRMYSTLCHETVTLSVKMIKTRWGWQPSVTLAATCWSVDGRWTYMTCGAVQQETAKPLFELQLEVGAQKLRHFISSNELRFH